LHVAIWCAEARHNRQGHAVHIRQVSVTGK
jgi:hypothetical protein